MSTGAAAGCVPWLQSSTLTVTCDPLVALAGPLTVETVKSGLLPTPICFPASRLLPSLLSATVLDGSAMAPR